MASFHPLLAILDDAQLNAVALVGDVEVMGVKHREKFTFKTRVDVDLLWKIPPNFVRDLVGFFGTYISYRYRYI